MRNAAAAAAAAAVDRNNGADGVHRRCFATAVAETTPMRIPSESTAPAARSIAAAAAGAEAMAVRTHAAETQNANHLRHPRRQCTAAGLGACATPQQQ